MLTQTTKTVSNQDEAEEAQEHRVEFFEPREDSAIALQASEQPLDLISALVHGPVVFLRVKPGTCRGNNRNEPQVQRQLARLVPLIGAIHE